MIFHQLQRENAFNNSILGDLCDYQTHFQFHINISHHLFSIETDKLMCFQMNQKLDT